MADRGVIAVVPANKIIETLVQLSTVSHKDSRSTSSHHKPSRSTSPRREPGRSRSPHRRSGTSRSPRRQPRSSRSSRRGLSRSTSPRREHNGSRSLQGSNYRPSSRYGSRRSRSPQRTPLSASTTSHRHRRHSHSNAHGRLTDSRLVDTTECAVLNGYVLIGDSMVVRVAKHSLKLHPKFSAKTKKSHIGLAIGGLTIGQLNSYLAATVGLEKALYMCGVNDVLQGASAGRMSVECNVAVHLLRRQCKEIIILTLPPCAAFSDSQLAVVKEFNATIVQELPKLQTDTCQVKVIDVFPYFEGRPDLFETVYERSGKEDGVHFNAKGVAHLLSHISC